MEKKLKIGIPRAFLYYRNYILWKTFFEGIGFHIVLSSPTNNEIVESGKYLSVDENCLPFKIYLGHVKDLINKCDYVLVPRICNYGKEKRVCIRFNGIYDVVCNIFNKDKVIDYNIDNIKFRYEFFEFVKMGLRFNKNIFKIIYYYLLGKKKEKKYNETLINSQINVLKSNKLKILIVSHPYIVYDDFLGGIIIDFLKKEDVGILYSDRMVRKESIYYSKDLSNTLYFLYSKENIGSIVNYKSAIDGVIILSSFPCGPDSLVNELVIRKVDDIPIINLILDESTSTSGLYTRLESFIDIVRARRDNE